MTMYRGKRRFSREQVVFMVEVALCSALDRIESAIPSTVPLAEYEQRKDEIDNYILGCEATAGFQVAVIIAQLTGEGCGACDWVGYDDWESLVENFVIERTDIDHKIANETFPDVRPLAEKIVKENLDDHGPQAQRDSMLASSAYPFAEDN